MNLFKKTTASIALVALVSGIFSTGVSANSATEIEAANALADMGYINDNSDDTAGYNLNQNVLRQEIAAVARGIADLDKKTSCDDSFSDVSATTPNTWACFSVEALLDADLIAANDMFNPENEISKAEAIGMMVKAAFGDDYSYDSESSASWQEQVVEFAVSQGIVANFTNYDTAATRGFVFEAGNNAIIASEEVVNECDEVSQLLGLCDEEDTTEDDDTTTEDDDTTTEDDDVVVSGDNVLSVELSPETPSSATVPGAVNGLPVAKFDFTAGSEDVTVTQVTIKRRGLSDKDTLLSLAAFTDEGRASNEKNDNQENDTEAQLNLSDGGVIVKAGETKTLTIVADLGEATDAANDEFAIEIVDVVASSDVTGVTNLVAHTLRIGSVDAPTLTFDNGSTVSDPTLGEEGADIFEFEIEGDGNEDVIVKSITFEGSSDAEDDLANFELYFGNDLVAETASMKDDYLTFDLGDGIVIEEDKNEDFTVKADVVEGASDKISFSIDEALDVTAVSTKFGYGASIDLTSNSVNAAKAFGEITIEAGELTLVEIEPDFDEIREDKDNVVLGKIKVTNVAGQNLELQEFGVKIILTPGNAELPGNANGSLTVDELFDDVELFNEETGSSYELTTSATGTNLVYSENNIDVILPQGTTIWSIRADTADEINDFDTASFAISFETRNQNASTEGSFYVEETDDDAEVKDITPSSITFNTIDGSESGAQASLIPLSDTDVVRGANDVVALQFEVEADESSDIFIDEFVVAITGTGSNPASNQEISDIKLYKGSVSDANELDLESGSNISTSSGEVVFNDFSDILIAANATETFIVTVSIVDSVNAVNNSDYTVSLVSVDVEDDENDDVDVTGLTVPLASARQIAVNNAGTISTLAFDDANSDNEFDKLALAGENVVIASFDVRADNEEVDVETVTFNVTGPTGGTLSNSVINASLLLDGVVVATNQNNQITDTTIKFDDITDLILPETTSELALQLNTANIGDDFVGVTQTGITITNVVLEDAEGVESGKDLVGTFTSTAGPSKTLDIVTAIVTPAVVSTFGTDDQTAEISLNVNGGNNTDTNGDAVQAELTALSIEVTSVTSTGTFTVFNGNGDNIGTGSVLVAGAVTITVTSDSIGNDQETYRIETTADASYRLAKDGVTYTINGVTPTTTKLENTLELGQYSNSN